MAGLRGRSRVPVRGLHKRVQRGAYRPQPSRRTYIPKADGKQRPLAVAALEEKIVQGATVMVLNAIYEGDFCGFSYGFRPGRGPHDALDALCIAIDKRKVNWIIDADIQNFFGAVSQKWLVRFLEHRIGDKRIIRLIQKWLRAGILEDGVVTVDDRGTGQGSEISPLLGNIYLHYVLDLWVQRWRQLEATGDMLIVRYADDVVVGFERDDDARRFLDAMRARLEEFELSLHPDKTRLIEFGRYAAASRKQRGLRKPETFTYLGFTLICGKSRKGHFQLQRKTRADRMRAKLKEVKEALRHRWHHSIPQQGEWLRQVVRGHFAYFAVPTNGRAISAFRYHVVNLWRLALKCAARKTRQHGPGSRRSSRTGSPCPASFIRGRRNASPSNTRGRSHVRESRMRGSVRGVPTAIMAAFRIGRQKPGERARVVLHHQVRVGFVVIHADVIIVRHGGISIAEEVRQSFIGSRHHEGMHSCLNGDYLTAPFRH